MIRLAIAFYIRNLEAEAAIAEARKMKQRQHALENRQYQSMTTIKLVRNKIAKALKTSEIVFGAHLEHSTQLVINTP